MGMSGASAGLRDIKGNWCGINRFELEQCAWKLHDGQKPDE